MAEHVVAFWNLENLFGPENHPHRIDWIREAVGRDLSGWTPALYARKIAQLARVIAGMNAGAGPDILGVCEVEDGHVLRDLAAEMGGRLPARRYAAIHADSERDRRGIDTAFLYDADRYDHDPATVFSHFVMRRTGTRDILQATIVERATGAALVTLANHWPSRSGGAAESAGFRAVAGETLAYFHERIRQVLGVDACVLAMGDMNDDPWDPSVRFNANASRERGDVARAQSARFWNAGWDYLRTEAVDRRGGRRTLDGTLYFRGDGNLFDQILLSPPLLNGRGALAYVEASAAVIAPPEMVDHRVGEGPVRFGLPRGDAAANVDEDGFSDHFPVACRLTGGA